jgi:hypothetical protein
MEDDRIGQTDAWKEMEQDRGLHGEGRNRTEAG